MVGWYPQGNCSQATQWFGIGLTNDGDPIPVSSLPSGNACQCQ